MGKSFALLFFCLFPFLLAAQSPIYKSHFSFDTTGRGKRLIYFESEYRRDITGNGLLGFVLFANINSAGQLANNRFEYWNPAGGTGLRIKFNKKSDTNICIDYGISKRYSTFILSLGEAF